MERKVYRDVIFTRLRHLDLKWFIHKAYVYIFLKIEKYLKSGRSPAPLACGLVVTENCNMRCPMCVLPHRYLKNRNDQDSDTWKLVIDNLHELGIGGIAISGGEPTLRADVFELVAHARKNDTTVTLNSNMVSLSDKQIRQLIAADPNNVNVSIDSGREDLNDQLRGGKNVLAKVLDRIRALSAAREAAGKKFSITVVTTLSDANLDDLDILFEKVSKCGADRICFIPLHDIKNGITYLVESKKVKPDLFEHLLKLSEKYGLALENSSSYLKNFYHVMTGNVMKENCNAGYTHLVIGTDLKIYRCIPYMNMDRYLFKWDPARQSLKELWNSPKWRKDRLEALHCKECFWDCHAEVNYLIPM
ncbi:MAG: radical SAM protein [Sedimentisphaerales bacterium]|nr:radical SAM protein [Sedimentisphaerales bacterium]